MSEDIQPSRILLVEDEPGFRTFIRRRLSASGFEVETATSGEEALSYLKNAEHHIDLVLLDYLLPDTNAQELISAEWASVGSPAFMVMTGFGDERLAVDLMKLGAVDYIIKDSDLPNVLIPTVERILRHERQRKQLDVAERQLQESEERLKLALHSAGIAVWDIDATTNLAYVDERWQNISGMVCREGQVPLEVLQNTIVKEDQPYYFRRWNSFLQQSQTALNFEASFRIQHEQSPMRWMEQQGVIVERHEDGSPRRIMCTLHDITDKMRLREMEEQLLRAQRMDMLGTLAGGIAHDFNNILAAIIGFNELMKRDTGNQQIVDNATGQIERAAQRAKDIVRQVLLFSRREEPEIKRVDLIELIDEAVAFMRAVVPSGVTITQKHEVDSASIDADASQISQVLTNLINNAAQAMTDDEGMIQVTLKLQPSGPEGNRMYCVEVQDDGSGIPVTIQERIFEPFFSTKEKGKGTGLGLATSRGIIESHGGRITLQSEEGHGACFSLFLPPSREEGVTHQPPVERSEPLEASAIRILLVDDEIALAEVTTELLILHGFEVDAYHDPMQALEYCQSTREQYDLAILDYSMPRLNGLDLLKKLQEMQPDLHCLLVTGNLDNSQGKVQEFPHTERIHKPFSHDELLDAIMKATPKIVSQAQ